MIYVSSVARPFSKEALLPCAPLLPPPDLCASAPGLLTSSQLPPAWPADVTHRLQVLVTISTIIGRRCLLSL